MRTETMAKTSEDGAVRCRLMVVSTMTSPEGERYTEKHAGPCMLTEMTEGIRLSWQEKTDADQMQIDLTIRGNTAVMHRSGSMQGDLTFSEGKRCTGLYKTPYGSFDVLTDTRTCTLLRQETGGEIRLHYRLFMQGALTSTAQLELTWKR